MTTRNMRLADLLETNPRIMLVNIIDGRRVERPLKIYSREPFGLGGVIYLQAEDVIVNDLTEREVLKYKAKVKELIKDRLENETSQLAKLSLELLLDDLERLQ